MSRTLVFVSGASSGIGRALAESFPQADARVVDISRRGGAGFEHLEADLADPAGWRRVRERFEAEVPGFGGERVVFVHAAGTLDPIGAAAAVDAAAYQRNVLLNSAAPQVLGAAFLAALRRSRARGLLLLISSGAASHVYEGWSSYGAGKAALDQWVRVVGAEERRAGDRCRVLAVAPGIVATAMQEEIRRTPARDFPEVARFTELYEQGELREPAAVAREIWQLAERELPNGAVVDLRELAERDGRGAR